MHQALGGVPVDIVNLQIPVAPLPRHLLRDAQHSPGIYSGSEALLEVAPKCCFTAHSQTLAEPPSPQALVSGAPFDNTLPCSLENNYALYSGMATVPIALQVVSYRVIPGQELCFASEFTC